jgi:hypothetical protein
MKLVQQPIVMITAYDYPIAQAAQVDMVLMGDSARLSRHGSAMARDSRRLRPLFEERGAHVRPESENALTPPHSRLPAGPAPRPQRLARSARRLLLYACACPCF